MVVDLWELVAIKFAEVLKFWVGARGGVEDPAAEWEFVRWC